MKNEVLSLNKDALSKLSEKDPKVNNAWQDVLINSPLQGIDPFKFQSIDKEMIRKASIRTKGGTGRSGLDANGWRSILAPNSFGTSSSDLRKTFANVVQKLCTDLVETR